MVPVQIDKSLFDENTMVLRGQDDTNLDLWYVEMSEDTYERMAPGFYELQAE